jgi:Holliday junction resolvase RusA-like endonuclease
VTMLLEITIPGDPQTQGNLRRSPHGPGLYDSNKDLPGWRNHAALAGHDAMNGKRPVDGPVRVTVQFTLKRPKSHHGKNGDLNAEGRRNPYPTSRATGDLDKYERAIGDALTGVVWADDARIVQKVSSKAWGPEPRTDILVETATPARPSDDPASRLRRLASAIGDHADDVDTAEHLGAIVATVEGFGACQCGRLTDPLHRYCSGCGRPTHSAYAQDPPRPTKEDAA